MSEVVAHHCSCLCHKGMASHVAACRCERPPLIVGRHPKADVAGVPYDSDEWAEGTIGDGQSPTSLSGDAPQPADQHIGAES